MEGTMAEIRMFAGNFAPRTWMYCQGQLLAVSSNTALFSLLGTTYGGDGRTTFALPDFRGRVAVGTGNGPGLSNYVLGQKGGAETVTLILSQIPSHNHLTEVSNDAATSSTPIANGYLGALSTADRTTANRLYTATISSGVTQLNTRTISPVGGSQPHQNLQPYLAMNYIICVQGIFPSRN